MRLLIYCLPLLLLLGLLAGCASMDAAGARLIEARAPEYIGPAESYRATVHGVSRSHVDQVQLVGYGVKPDPNLVIDPLEITLTAVDFQREPFRITGLGRGAFSGRISESAINRYVQTLRRPSGIGELSDIQVKFLQNQVDVSAKVSVMGVGIPFGTSGRIEVDEGQRLLYRPEKLTLGGIGIPRGVQDLLASRVNPIVDLSGLRFTPRVENISVNQGELLFSGTATLRDLSAQMKTPDQRP